MANKLKTFIKIILIVAIPFTIYLIWLSLQRDISFNDSVRYDYDYVNNEYVCAMNYGNRMVIMRVGEDSKLKKVKVVSERYASGFKVRAININNKGKAVLLAEKTDSKGTRIVLARLDEDDRVEAYSDPCYIDEDYSPVSVKDEGDYYAITAINSELSQARAYIIQGSALSDGNETKTNTSTSTNNNSGSSKRVEAQSLSSYLAPAGRSIGYAYYHNGAFTVRTDTDTPLLDADAAKQISYLLSNVKLTLPQKFVTAGDGAKSLFLMMLVIIALLFFLFIFLSKRNRFFSTLFTSLVFIGMAMEGVLIFLNMANNEIFSKAAEESYYKRAETTESVILEAIGGIGYGPYEGSFYDTAAYESLKESLEEAMERFSESGVETHYLAVVNSSDNKIIASTDGRNRADAFLKFGTEYTELTGKISSMPASYCEKILYDGNQYTLLGYPISLENTNKVYVLALFTNPGMAGYQSKVFFRIMLASMIIAIISGFIAVMGIIRNHLDLKMIKNAAVRISEGETDFVSPKMIEPDMQPIWAAFTEIVRGMKDTRYSKESIYKAYFRFSPKNIENFLNKSSITDVLVGDQSRVDGTLAIFSLDSAEKARKSGELMKAGEFITYMKENGGSGMIAGNDSDLSTIDMLFDGVKKDTVELGTSLLLEMQKRFSGKEMSLFLFHSNFWFGVTGSNEQALTYIVSDDLKTFEKFGRWFASLSIALVITEDVKEREKTKSKIRYIGYIELSGGRRERLYEVLDATEANERLSKLSLAERFENTIELFYKRDYYLARAEFSKMLKQNPEDELCRWYLFECEKYLNSGVRPDDHAGALHTN